MLLRSSLMDFLQLNALINIVVEHDDMIIEQSLMKCIKIEGGIVRGRSTKESVLSKWVYGMYAMNNVCEEIEKFCNVSLDTTDQHVNAKDSRVQRDNTDVKKVIEWFAFHDPFSKINQILSIANGILGDDKINCYNAYETDLVLMKNMFGQNFNNIKLKRSDKVLPLLTANSCVKVHNTKIFIDPLLLFQRISIIKKFDKQLRDYLQYELAPYLLALFDEMGMRKTKKSSLFVSFEPRIIELDANVTYVIDG